MLFCLQRVNRNFRVVDEFHLVCTRRKLKLNAGKSKIMVYGRREAEVVIFNTPYGVSVLEVGRCEILLGERMNEVKKFPSSDGATGYGSNQKGS